MFCKSYLKLQVVKDPDLRERHLGDLQGISYREAAKTRPEAYKALLSQNRDQEIPVSAIESKLVSHSPLLDMRILMTLL